MAGRQLPRSRPPSHPRPVTQTAHQRLVRRGFRAQHRSGQTRKGEKVFYAMLGYLHAASWRLNVAVRRRVRGIHALAEERGQGTVEYVGLILLVSLLMVGMVAAMKGFNGKQGTELADVIVNKIKEAVDKVAFK